MQRQKNAGDDDSPFGQTQKDLDIKPLSIQVPDVHESMRLAGAKDLRIQSNQDSSRSQSYSQRRLVCCCGNLECRIGPMTQSVEVSSR